MNCPLCGYQMTSLDKECPRCKGMGVPQQPVPFKPQQSPSQFVTPPPTAQRPGIQQNLNDDDPVLIALSVSAQQRKAESKSALMSGLGVLALMLTVGGFLFFNHMQHERARSEARARISSLNLILLMAMEDNDGQFPRMPNADGLKVALIPTIDEFNKTRDGSPTEASIFIDPRTEKPFIPNPSLSGIDQVEIEEVANVVSLYSPEADGDKRLVGYADGHIEWVPETDWITKKSAGSVGTSIPVIHSSETS